MNTLLKSKSLKVNPWQTQTVRKHFFTSISSCQEKKRERQWTTKKRGGF